MSRTAWGSMQLQQDMHDLVIPDRECQLDDLTQAQ